MSIDHSNNEMPQIEYKIWKPQLTTHGLAEEFIPIINNNNVLKEHEFSDSQEHDDNTETHYKLERLNLSNRKLSHIPDFIENFLNLKELDLSNNLIQDIPDTFEWPKSLLVLKLNNNKLTKFSDSFLYLNHLAILYLHNNQISIISNKIDSLTSINELNISNNFLTELPETIGNLKNLSIFDIENNRLKALPESFSRLQNLKTLNISFNELKHLPLSLTTLYNLSQLDLNNTKLKELPDSFKRLINLNKLSIENNFLTQLPKSIGSLKNLNELFLEGNQLVALPESIKNLKLLETLKLNNNQLKTLPESIELLTNLRQLILEQNQLTTLPISIGNLKKLVVLVLKDNQLSNIPESIGNLINLLTLNLARNQLSFLPESIGNLKRLSALNLENNQFAYLPYTIVGLNKLQKLNIKQNKFKIIPESLAILSKLKELLIDGNPYTIPPPPEKEESEKKSNIDIIEHIRTYYNCNYLNAANLLIIGEEGKSSLYREFESDQIKQTDIQNMANKIWLFEIEKDREFQVNIWESTYQDILYSNKFFLLSKNTFTLLLIDERIDINILLNELSLLARKTPFLIINHKKDISSFDISENVLLYQQFPNLKGVMSIDLEKRENVSSLVKDIKNYLINLPHISMIVNNRWIDVRNHLLSIKDSAFIKYDLFLDICIQNDLNERFIQQRISECLHALKYCFHFQDNVILNNYILLNLDWFFNQTERLFQTEDIINNSGIFSISDLNIVFRENQQKEQLEIFLQLMKQFEFCYEVKKNSFIIPHLLKTSRPGYNWKKLNKDVLIYQYKYNYFPHEIITKLIIQMYSLFHEHMNFWKHGILIQKDNAVAEINTNMKNKIINIQVTAGPDSNNVIDIIDKEMNRIHKLYKSLSYEKKNYISEISKRVNYLESESIKKFSPLRNLEVDNKKEIARINSEKNLQTSQFEQIQKLLTQAKEFEEHFDYIAAIEQYRKIIHLEEHFIKAWEGIKNIYKRIDRNADEISSRIDSLKSIVDYENNIDSNIRLRHFELKNLAFFDNFRWQFTQMNVLLGKNGYGKSHLLRFIISLLQKNTLSAEYFNNCNEGAFSEINLNQNEKCNILIRRTYIDFDNHNTIGKIPVLAIPDSRFIDKSELSIIYPDNIENNDLRDSGAYHFLTQKPYSSRIDLFLYDIGQAYRNNDCSFDNPFFHLLQNVIQQLIDDEFRFFSIDYIEQRREYRIKVITEGNKNNPLPIQQASQGTLSILSIFGTIYLYLKSLYGDIKELLKKRAIVFIDELDAHLHPVWHQKIVWLLKRTFPNVQFFVSAHSPLIAAGCLRDEVSVLRKSKGDLFKLFKYKKDFIGVDPIDIYREIFEIKNTDESYSYYTALFPFRKRIENEIESYNKKKNLTYQEHEEYKKLNDELFYLKKTKQQREKRLDDEEFHRQRKIQKIQQEIKIKGNMGQ